jgi:TetR/AcrR family transcriptional repressor of nem operon
MRPKSFDQSEALDAAMLLFWETGYEASSMQQLVDRMGISRQSLYDTYGNKRELFEAALKRYRNERIEPLIAEIRRPELAPIDALRYFLLGSADGSDDSPAGCLMVRTASSVPVEDSAIADFVAACIGDMRDVLRERIEQGQHSGDIVSERAAGDIAGEVIALGIGLQVMQRLPRLNASIRSSIETLLSTLSPGDRAGLHS